LILCLGLAAITLAVYAPVRHHGFVSLDDTVYVTENAYVADGLTAAGLAWALTGISEQAANWHPLTWVSHMIDVQLFGMRAGAHHMVSVALHALNATVLFLLLTGATGHPWRSLCVAAVFAVHPLNVESVAWVAERKNVLSTLFWFLTAWGYVQYVRRPGRARYAGVLVLFALALMAKPMAVTLPFTLLLLDWWPLNRLTSDRRVMPDWRRWVPLLVEKWPFLLLSALSSAITVFAQRRGGAVVALDAIPLATRAANAALSYVTYAWQMVWPSKLSVFYPHEGTGSMTLALFAMVGLVVVTVAVFRVASRRPHLGVGWLWYLGTLVPVIGLIQVGMQAHADRYVYVPMVGLLLMVIWECAERARSRAWLRVAAAVSAGAMVVAYGATARAQLANWADDAKLWTHALDVDPNNYYAHYSVGRMNHEGGRQDGALRHLERAVELAPWFAEVHDVLGLARAKAGQVHAAIAAHMEALRLKPGLVSATFNLGLAYEQRGDVDAAIRQYREALGQDPGRAAAHAALGHALAAQGHIDAAVASLRKAVELNPEFVPARRLIGTLLLQQGGADEALRHFEEVVRLEPGSADARSSLGSALAGAGRLESAAAQYAEAVRLAPADAGLRYSLGVCLARMGRLAEAIPHLSEAVRLQPQSDTMRVSLGMALGAAGDRQNAAMHFDAALKANPGNQDARAGLQALGLGSSRRR